MRTLWVVFAWLIIVATIVYMYRGERDFRRLMREIDEEERRHHHQWTEDDL